MSAHANFYTVPRQNMRRSKEEGRAIFEDVEMVRVRLPHDARCIHTAPAAEKVFVEGEFLTYAERFPQEYAAFKAGEEQRASGTPLERMGTLSAASIAELNSVAIYSVESLADLGIAQQRRLGPLGAEMKKAAIEFLSVSQKVAGAQALQAQIDELKAELAAARAAKSEAPATGDDDKAGDEFDAMSDAELKDVIKMLTGTGPAGNPKRETLLKQARDATAAVRTREAESA